MPQDTVFTGKTNTGASDPFPTAGFDYIEVDIWSTQVNPDAVVEIQSRVTDSVWFTLASADLSSLNPAAYSIPPTDEVRVDVITNASGKAVNATILRTNERN